MKKESMIGRRLYAWIIDTLILFVLVFLVDGLVSVKAFNAWTDIQQVSESYIDHSNQYNLIQDEYNIYIYDGENNRVYNENINEETKTAFLNDARILELNEKLISEQEYILQNFILRISFSIFIGSLLVYIILPLCLKGGRTIGKTAAKLYVLDDSLNKKKWYMIMIRYFISIIFNVYLALFTMGIIPLINLLIAINHKDNKSIPDLICKTVIVDGKLPIDLLTKRIYNEVK